MAMSCLRICIDCGKLLAIKDFYEDKIVKDGYKNQCKECCKKRSRKQGPRIKEKQGYYKKNKEKVLKRNKKWNEENFYCSKSEIPFKQRKEAWIRLFKEQDGCCAICKIHQSELDKRLCIDHNHKTGKIRGLLCGNCNSTIGFAKEHISNLIRAIGYLRKYNNFG